MSTSEPALDRGLPEIGAGEDPAALAFWWNSIGVHLVRRLRKADVAMGLPPAQASALSVLVFGGRHTLGELAAREQVTPPTMSRVVTGLERRGMARRVRDAADRRVVHVEATARGRQVMERGRTARVERLQRDLSALPADERAMLARAARIFLALPDSEDY